MRYDAFLAAKLRHVPPTGIAAPAASWPHLFPFQSALVRWALRRGRAALFADTGLGKSRMQLTWAQEVHNYTGRPVLILAPLAVAAQTVREGEAIGIQVTYARSQTSASSGITIANYEMLQHFDPRFFGAIILDESSILKDYNSSTRNAIIEAFAATPFKLACTATPSPNDFTELGNHAEFLGVMSRTEMLSMFFVHDGGSTQDWRLKGHATDAFWRWICNWAALVKKPSDLGFPDDGYDLPPLEMIQHDVSASLAQVGARFFVATANTLEEQRAARRASLPARVAKAAELVNHSSDPWVVWCELNDESEALVAAIPHAVEVRGSMKPEEKEKALTDFAEGRVRVIVSKPSICGFGLNWQHCADVAFVGVSHSFEQWYQAIRRCWRFGQKKSVRSHVIVSELEGAIVANLRRKEADAMRLAEETRKYTAAVVRENVRGLEKESAGYEPTRLMTIPNWIRTEAA